MKKCMMILIAAFAAASTVQAADDAKVKQERTQKQKLAQCQQHANERKMKGEQRDTFIRKCSGNGNAAAAVGRAINKSNSKNAGSGG
jgi:hypothetical protein